MGKYLNKGSNMLISEHGIYTREREEEIISKYIKFFHEMASNDDDKEIASDLKLSVNEDKTKFRILMNMEQSADDLWWKAKTSILYTKK